MTQRVRGVEPSLIGWRGLALPIAPLRFSPFDIMPVQITCSLALDCVLLYSCDLTDFFTYFFSSRQLSLFRYSVALVTLAQYEWVFPNMLMPDWGGYYARS